jgi:hypothetical protein
VFDAVNGDKLWSQYLGISECTSPITYRVGAIQYVAVGAAGCAHSTGLLKDGSKSRCADTIAIYALMPQRSAASFQPVMKFANDIARSALANAWHQCMGHGRKARAQQR